ncbi:MAG: hypothetical protein CVU87_00900 [Firmicutes bacterium HGW-Firmicutes-12]|jgi:hypothetical protein|nr:MAG: hypothetical protein CVU87_00900 [Firmicutes bacterium HGW-Firmicutes-12]
MKLKIGDCVIIAIVLTAALFIPLLYTNATTEEMTAVVVQDNRVIQRINLASINEPVTIQIIDDFHNVIVAENGRARFKESDCPDTVCVHTGWLTRPGEIAVCLPNKTFIKLEGHNLEEDQVDIIVK